MSPATWILLGIAAIVVNRVFTAYLAKRKEELHTHDLDHQDQVKANLEADQQLPFVLYLRDFDNDQEVAKVKIATRFGGSVMTPMDTYELNLKKTIEKIAPMVCIGNSEGPEKMVGAARYYYDNENWQTAALDLMQRAIMILYRPSTSPGTFWEYERLKEHGFLTKSIFIFSKQDQQLFRPFLEQMGDDLPEIPLQLTHDIYIQFDKNMNPLSSSNIDQLPLYKRLFQRYKKDAF